MTKQPPAAHNTAKLEPYSQKPAGELMVRRSTSPSVDQSTAPEREAAGAALASARWKLHIGSARIVWSRLSEAELLESGGDAGKLSLLVQARYSRAAPVADRQVLGFLSQYKL